MFPSIYYLLSMGLNYGFLIIHVLVISNRECALEIHVSCSKMIMVVNLITDLDLSQIYNSTQNMYHELQLVMCGQIDKKNLISNTCILDPIAGTIRNVNYYFDVCHLNISNFSKMSK